MLKIIKKYKEKHKDVNKPFSSFSGHEFQYIIGLCLSFDRLYFLGQFDIQQLSLSEILYPVIRAMFKI